MNGQNESRATSKMHDQLISFAMSDEDYVVNIQTVKEAVVVS